MYISNAVCVDRKTPTPASTSDRKHTWNLKIQVTSTLTWCSNEGSKFEVHCAISPCFFLIRGRFLLFVIVSCFRSLTWIPINDPVGGQVLWGYRWDSLLLYSCPLRFITTFTSNQSHIQLREPQHIRHRRYIFDCSST